MIKKFVKFFSEPRIAFSIFILFIGSYLIILDEEGAFTKQFLTFGPSEDTKFLNILLDSWHKVHVVYALAFFSSLLTTYYNNVSYDTIHSYIWNPLFTDKIKVPKTWVTIISLTEPLLYAILNIINLFINLTGQLQFILPSILGNLIIDIPHNYHNLKKQKYI